MSDPITIVRAEVLGYCMGVRRAVEAAEQALLDSPIRPVYTYGPLIHNPSALERLRSAGVVILAEGDSLPDDFRGASVVIRAHGVPPETRAEIERRGARVIDATCPRVLSSQKRAEAWHRKGYAVVLAGDRDHGEITSIAGSAPGCVVVENPADVAGIDPCPERAVLISQTTIKQSEYDAIAQALAARVADLVVLNTICPATQERQAALEELASRVDGILVVGGRASANTQRLFATARSLIPASWLIEGPEEIPAEASSLARIGITAGASTPDEVIDAVEQALQKR
jgi:4-hydroxy-3-methylbut-2-enyl diphosphate reductase